ncbi:aspartate-alanine antiporter [Andreprevotia chitinilytica]|uniref:aspartate-alanine antiporter n=1 Tax=Andreprevotia chitinilytica TaxID=396808 RepID=UPI00054D5082|nr:aspartate-alanine antiporter [Andreprevotia chitinilytica]
MLEGFAALLHRSPEIALFLALAIGHAVGAIRCGPIQLGGICGTLLAALAIGSFGVTPDPGIKSFFFVLFIFALGFAGGPQFFASLNAKGLRLALFCIIEITVVLVMVMIATRLFGLDQGSAAGLMAGAATESAVVGTASDAVSKLPLTDALIQQLQANVVTAYSITYVFGLVTIVVATSQLFPLLLGMNVRAEAERLWQKMGGQPHADGATSMAALPVIVGRVYRAEAAAGKSVADIEALYPTISIERIGRGDAVFDATPQWLLQAQDRVLVTGHREDVLALAPVLGPEESRVGRLDFVIETADIVFNRRELAGQSLRQLHQATRESGINDGVQFIAVSRSGQALPMAPDLDVQVGDVIRAYGSSRNINRLLPWLGPRVDQSNQTDFFYAGLGMVLGIAIGLFSIRLGGVPFSLGTGGGALLTGLIFGWYQSLHPHIGHIPESAVALLKDLGLAMFIACVGLSSGPQASVLIKKYGFALPLTGVLIALIPATLSLLVGRYLLKLEAPVLLGAIAGQQCSTPALSAVVNTAGNATPLLGYTITYAISNVVLPLMGPLIVFMAGQVGVR